MLMIRSIVRPTKVDNVLAALMEAGFPAVTKDVGGRPRQAARHKDRRNHL